jgi:hypothetical protein
MSEPALEAEGGGSFYDVYATLDCVMIQKNSVNAATYTHTHTPHNKGSDDFLFYALLRHDSSASSIAPLDF